MDNISVPVIRNFVYEVIVVLCSKVTIPTEAITQSLKCMFLFISGDVTTAHKAGKPARHDFSYGTGSYTLQV